MYQIGLFEGLEAMAKGLGKPVMYISFPVPDLRYDELRKAAPYLFDGDQFKFPQLLMDGSGYVVCDSEEEMERLYDLTVGDDGPTATNPYNGPARIYALTSSGNENT